MFNIFSYICQLFFNLLSDLHQWDGILASDNTVLRHYPNGGINLRAYLLQSQVHFGLRVFGEALFQNNSHLRRSIIRFQSGKVFPVLRFCVLLCNVMTLVSLKIKVKNVPSSFRECRAKVDYVTGSSLRQLA